MEKIQEIQAALKKQKIDAALLINTTIKDPNMLYLTNLELEYSFLLIPKNSEAIFCVSALEYERAKKYSAIKNVIKFQKPLKEIKNLLKGKTTIGLNEAYITLATKKTLEKEWKGKKYKPTDMIYKTARIIKTQDEAQKLQKAAAIADKIFEELTKELQTNRSMFKTEKDIAEFIDQRAKKWGDGSSFETIVASGKNAALPHYVPQNVPIQKGFCVLDFGVRYKNYISDISRTIFFGAPTKEEITNYTKVKNANERAINELKIGRKLKDIDKRSRKEFNYPHSLGHGIGVEVHEAPNVSPKSKDTIKENMCFTIEPGMYVPEKFGIRIEDDIWMTKNNTVQLTKSTKELRCFQDYSYSLKKSP
ncbi:MAG: Xaa-Pro peptidase family protein [Nanoarchaeota archaeon]